MFVSVIFLIVDLRGGKKWVCRPDVHPERPAGMDHGIN